MLSEVWIHRQWEQSKNLQLLKRRIFTLVFHLRRVFTFSPSLKRSCSWVFGRSFAAEVSNQVFK